MNLCKGCIHYREGVRNHYRTGLPCGTMDWCSNIDNVGDLINFFPRRGRRCPYYKTEGQRLKLLRRVEWGV